MQLSYQTPSSPESSILRGSHHNHEITLEFFQNSGNDELWRNT